MDLLTWTTSSNPSRMRCAAWSMPLDSLIERYRGEGYEVSREPGADAIPFDLGGYRPDLVAKKAGQGRTIEVGPQAGRISFDRLRTVAGEVKQQPGWQFLLVTRQDAEDVALPGTTEDPFAWEEAAATLSAAESAESREDRLVAFRKLRDRQRFGARPQPGFPWPALTGSGRSAWPARRVGEGAA